MTEFYSAEQIQLLEYFTEAPSPLGSKPFPYNNTTIRTLLERLRPYNLTKAEVVMIMNIRPATQSALNTVIEQMEERYGDEQQAEMVEIIGEVLGRPDGEAERLAMAENATQARNEEIKQFAQQEQLENNGA